MLWLPRICLAVCPWNKIRAAGREANVVHGTATQPLAGGTWRGWTMPHFARCFQNHGSKRATATALSAHASRTDSLIATTRGDAGLSLTSDAL